MKRRTKEAISGGLPGSIILVAASWPTPPTKTLAENAIIRAGDLVGSWAETVSPYENPAMLGTPPLSGISSYSMVDFENLTSDINKTLHVNVFLMVFNTTSQAVDYYWSVWHTSS
jgi:hypothetical protein